MLAANCARLVRAQGVEGETRPHRRQHSRLNLDHGTVSNNTNREQTFTRHADLDIVAQLTREGDWLDGEMHRDWHMADGVNVWPALGDRPRQP